MKAIHFFCVVLTILSIAAFCQASPGENRTEKLPRGGGKCTDNKDCGIHGACDNLRCGCDNGYTDEYCTYSRKSRLTAFLLSFFLSEFGGGRYYMELYLSAVFQMLIGVVFLSINILCCCLRVFGKKEKKYYKVLSLFSGLLSLTTFAWWLADCIIFGTNSSQDGNGVYPFDDMGSD